MPAKGDPRALPVLLFLVEALRVAEDARVFSRPGVRGTEVSHALEGRESWLARRERLGGGEGCLVGEWLRRRCGWRDGGWVVGNQGMSPETAGGHLVVATETPNTLGQVPTVASALVACQAV